MARPERNSVDYFPVFNPQHITKSRILSNDYKKRYKALRSSSSGFIKKETVRDYIFKRDNNRCCICNSTDNLNVDHKISVHQFALNNWDYKELNTEVNLQTLCNKCNTSKKP